MKKEVFLLILIIGISIAYAQEDCYKRINPVNGAEACCKNSGDCVDDNGNCIRCKDCREIIFEDDFMNTDISKLSAFGGSWKIEEDIQADGNNGFVLSQSNKAAGTMWLGNTEWKDYTIDFNVKIIKADYSDSFSVIFYMVDPNIYYEYRINNKIMKKYKVFERFDTFDFTKAKQTSCNKLDKWCKVRIKIHNEKDTTMIKVYVNEQEIFNQSANEANGLTSGRIAFKTYNAAVKFDDLVISKTDLDDFDLDNIPDRCDYCSNTLYGCVVYTNGCAVDLNGDGRCDTIMELLYDMDKDDFVSSKAPGGKDCDDYDDKINPNAVEICNDLKDNNCDGLIDCNETSCENFCKSSEQTNTTKTGFFEMFLKKIRGLFIKG